MKNKAVRKAPRKGQVAVFMVLIFPIFFIFGAMVINIGMVVHDKINLQNSVDLAAIYGAQKQAEVLSALAHINYQIRQSYKLMAWRYIMIGNLGANYRAGQSSGGARRYKIASPTNSAQPQQHCNALFRSCNAGPCGEGPVDKANKMERTDQLCAYAVCMGHEFWEWQSGSDHLCQDRNLGDNLTLRPQIPAADALFRAIGQNTVFDFVGRANDRFDEIAKQMKLLNWYIASTFLFHFRFDQGKRKILAKNLFDYTLKTGKDIEGNSIEEGVENTIKNNLTFINYINYGDGSVEVSSSIPQGKSFDDYFKWQAINPILFYLKTNIPENRSNTRETALDTTSLLPIFALPVDDPTAAAPPGPGLGLALDNLLLLSAQASAHSSQSANNPYSYGHVSSGFYKTSGFKPISITVKAKIPYKSQIFFPMTKEITLKAEAYAKPFGASFGPPLGADPLLPTGNLPTVPPRNANSLDYRHFLPLAPNHSSYPGDNLGLFNQAVQHFWTTALINNAAGTGKKNINYMDIRGQPDPMVLDWSASGVHQDFLKLYMRQLEEMAIAPDLFDITYYTILPNYMTTLYRKMVTSHTGLSNAVKSELKQEGFDTFIPGDLGYINPEIYDISNTFSELTKQTKPCFMLDQKPYGLNFIQKQIQCITAFTSSPVPSALNKVTKMNHVLTSWYPISKGGYNSDGLYQPSTSGGLFGECTVSDNTIKKNISSYEESGGKIKPQSLIPQHCIVGGRSGFSVKLIDQSMAPQ